MSRRGCGGGKKRLRGDPGLDDYWWFHIHHLRQLPSGGGDSSAHELAYAYASVQLEIERIAEAKAEAIRKKRDEADVPPEVRAARDAWADVQAAINKADE